MKQKKHSTMPLFSFQVKEGQPYELHLQNSAVWFGSATLVKGEKLTLSVAQKTKKPINIACLNATWGTRNVKLNHKLDSESVVFEGKGNGVVELVCEKQDFCDVDSAEEEEEEEEEVCEECPTLVPVAKKQKRGPVEEKTPERPAKKQKIDPETEKKQRQEQLRAVEAAKRKKAEEERKLKQQEEEQREEQEKKRQLAEKAKKEAEEQRRIAELKRKEEQKNKQEQEQEKKQQKGVIKKTLPCGVQMEIYKQGSGGVAKVGRNVRVQYEGRLASNGKRFDKGAINFRLGLGEVIKGWDEGVKGMMVGEKRKLMIPPRLAYGAQGAPPDIPRNATLIFDVCLLKA